MDQRDRFAARCGTSFLHLRNCSLGFKTLSAVTAINVERESGGVIRVEQIRPDVDWAVIRNVKPTRRRPKPDAPPERKPARKTRA